MAVFHFNDEAGLHIDMLYNDLFYGEREESTPTHFRSGHAEFTTTWFGDFAWKRGDIVGRLDGVTELRYGEVIFKATGLGLDASVVWDFGEADNAMAAMRYLVSGNDSIQGTRFSDYLIGGDGRDAVVGRAGDDDVQGGAAADTLEGGAGNDGLSGGSGNDKLLGGSNKHRLGGGLGMTSFWAGRARTGSTAGRATTA